MSADERSINWYNEHANDYTAHVRNPDDSIYHSLYEKPAMYSLLPDLEGMTVISLGCGSGEDSNYLRTHGAVKSVGIDISARLIDIARTSYPDCEFQIGDMEHLDLPDNSFDFTYSSLAIHYIEDWRQVFKEVYRVLRPNSYFLFSCNHPIYSAMEVVSDDKTTKKAELSRSRDKNTNSVTIVSDYMTHKSIEAVNSELAVTTWHKPIGEIATEASEAGFLIADIKEPVPLPKMQDLSPRDYDTLVKIPNFVIFKLFKP